MATNDRLTGLQAEIDTQVLSLAKLRLRPICVAPVYGDTPAELRALAELLTDAARAMDPLIQRIAYSAGLASLSGASEYVGVVSAAVEDLYAAIVGRAERIEEERSGAAQSVIDLREHGLSARQLGIGR